MRRATTALLGPLGAVLLLPACGTGGDDEPASARTSHQHKTHKPTSDASTTSSPTGTTAATDSPSTAPDDGPPFPDSTARQEAKNSGEWDLVLTDVRIGDHEGYDRVVLEFSGTGTPGWTVGYVDEPVLDGSGETVRLDGDAFLDVYASGSTYPGPGDDSYDGPRQFQPANGGAVDDVYVAGTFEGSTQVLVGLDGEAVPFRVFALTGPPRLVVDVEDD
jgi:hypothetical protein